MADAQLKPVKNQNWYTAWNKDHTFCMACGIPEDAARVHRWPGLSTHHIIKRGRSDEPCNLIRLCQRCHDAAECLGTGKKFPWLTLGIILTIKKMRDPDNWNPERLKELRLKNLPDLLPVPDVLMHEWNQWQRLPLEEPPF